MVSSFPCPRSAERGYCKKWTILRRTFARSVKLFIAPLIIDFQRECKFPIEWQFTQFTLCIIYLWSNQTQPSLRNNVVDNRNEIQISKFSCCIVNLVYLFWRNNYYRLRLSHFFYTVNLCLLEKAEKSIWPIPACFLSVGTAKWTSSFFTSSWNTGIREHIFFINCRGIAYTTKIS